jgi:hypothetical protein
MHRSETPFSLIVRIESHAVRAVLRRGERSGGALALAAVDVVLDERIGRASSSSSRVYFSTMRLRWRSWTSIIAA